MKLRISNGSSFAHEFVAHSPGDLERGCREAWRVFASVAGIWNPETLELHVWCGEWSTSGMITTDGKMKIPPTPNLINRNMECNDWPGLWRAAQRSEEHGGGLSDLISWVLSSDVTRDKPNTPDLHVVKSSRKPGRPLGTTKPASERRVRTLSGVRVSDDELASYHAAAERAGVSPSRWVRDVLNAAVTPGYQQ